MSDLRLQGKTISRAQAVERAKLIAARVAANAERVERLRRLPIENVEAILESELDLLLRPRRWGGFGADWMYMVDTVSEVGRVCGSTAWCMGFLMHHQWWLSYFPEAAQATVYGTDPRPKIATAFAPFGKVTVVPGGYRISGEWRWASGVDYCDWAIVGGYVPGRKATDGGPALFNFLLKPGEFSVKDTWHSVGLKGTGSNNIVVDDVFVPQEHAIDLEQAREGTAPGCMLDDGILYRSSFAYQSPYGIISPMIGVARGAYDAFVAFTRERTSTVSGALVADAAPLQIRVGEAAAGIDAAYTIVENLNRILHEEAPVTLAHRIRAKRDFAFASRLLLNAVDLLFNIAGARGLDEDNPLQRAWRDTHAIANHLVLNTDVTYQNAGRAAFGLPPCDRAY
jgi:3-hydroxy-9,10-secoandrosta-1,3,5(10)-triene-9,17-dione monooxygenase